MFTLCCFQVWFILTFFGAYLGSKFPTTPPPRRKHLTGLQNSALLPDSFPLTKSKSHESQLAKSEGSDLGQTG